jgi:hypothetical protein
MAERITILSVDRANSGVRYYDERDKKNIMEFLNAVRRSIIDDQLTKKIYSSGKSAKSLLVGANQTTAYLSGDAYFQQQILGRRPGKFPPVQAIMDWIKEKGIQPRDISQKSLAFIIARKIAKKGTDITLKKRPALDVVKAVQDNYEQLSEAMRESIIGRMNSKLKVFNPNAK